MQSARGGEGVRCPHAPGGVSGDERGEKARCAPVPNEYHLAHRAWSRYPRENRKLEKLEPCMSIFETLLIINFSQADKMLH